MGRSCIVGRRARRGGGGRRRGSAARKGGTPPTVRLSLAAQMLQLTTRTHTARSPSRLGERSTGGVPPAAAAGSDWAQVVLRRQVLLPARLSHRLDHDGSCTYERRRGRERGSWGGAASPHLGVRAAHVPEELERAEAAGPAADDGRADAGRGARRATRPGARARPVLGRECPSARGSFRSRRRHRADRVSADRSSCTTSSVSSSA